MLAIFSTFTTTLHPRDSAQALQCFEEQPHTLRSIAFSTSVSSARKMGKLKLAMVAAMSLTNGIGKDGGCPGD